MESKEKESPTTVAKEKAAVVSFPELGHDSLPAFIQSVFKGIVQTTQCSNALPAITEDHGYWESFDAFNKDCTKQGSRILTNIGDLLQHSAVQCKWGSNHMSGKSAADIDEQFEKLVDANDILLENVGALLDEAAGIKKKGEEPIIMTSTIKKGSPMVSSWNKKKDVGRKGTQYKLLMAKNVQRPQLSWLDKVDNRNIPFAPYLKSKPNALLPIEDVERDDLEDLDRDNLSGRQKFSKHPYHYELSQFEPNDWQLETKTPKMYSPLEDTELTIVNSQELFNAMMEKLKQVSEIVIDLEHHNYRSFQGIVCLMQISTRSEDFIIDSLVLRDELSALNEIFTDPNVLKVLHGSDSDIGWLQRDFGVYMVNMFDTGQAARVLQEERFSLAHLLNKYCNITAQKQYQLADWRIRPLPTEMIQYAREDTHYLLYVYDILRNELISRGNELQNILRLVYTKSTDLCASLYQKQVCGPDSHLKIYEKYRKKFNPQQLECFRLLYRWRDDIARKEDESTGYILPNHMLFQIAETLPRDQQGIIACCNPVPPVVNQNCMEIDRLVAEGRQHDPDVVLDNSTMPENSITKMDEICKEKETEKFQIGSFDPRSGFEVYKVIGPKIQLKEPTLSMFEVILKEHLETTTGKKKANEFMEILKSPFEMYLPNTGKDAVEPKNINDAWQALSKKKIQVEESTEEKSVEDLADDALARNQDFLPLPVNESTVGKKKRRKHSLDNRDETPLREMIPKKSKANKPLSEHIDEMRQLETNSVSDFVPYDYSKADLKKFNAAPSNNKDVNLEQTEEPNFKGPIKTKVRSGARQMSFK